MMIQYLDDLSLVLKHLDVRTVERMAQAVLGAWKADRTVFCCGNGGSAASTCHFIADLTKLTAPPKGRPIRALALTESMSAISAIANDIAYHSIFVEQMRPFVAPGDVVIGFSTSGSSPNVIRAIEYANTVGAVTLGITGKDGARLYRLARHALVVDSLSVQHIEDATMIVAHILCLRVKELIARASSEETTFEERSLLLQRIVSEPDSCDAAPVVPPAARRRGNGGTPHGLRATGT